MKKVLKWIGIFFAGLLAIVVVVLVGLNISTTARLNKTYDVSPAQINISTYNTSIERGAYIYNTSCAECHGDNLAGTPFFNDAPIAYIPATNLTSGTGGIGSTYSDIDYVRAIQHGISPDGKPLIIMPSEDNVMLDQNLYKNMTMKNLLIILSKLRVQHINGVRILFPLTKQQKSIFKAFGVDQPV